MSTWKAVERKIAEILNEQWVSYGYKGSIERIPVTGRISGDIPDVSHPFYAIEIKHRATIPKSLKKASEYGIIPASSKALVGRLKNLKHPAEMGQIMMEFAKNDEFAYTYLMDNTLVDKARIQALRAAETLRLSYCLLIFHEKGMKYEDSIFIWIAP